MVGVCRVIVCDLILDGDSSEATQGNGGARIQIAGYAETYQAVGGPNVELRTRGQKIVPNSKNKNILKFYNFLLADVINSSQFA